MIYIIIKILYNVYIYSEYFIFNLKIETKMGENHFKLYVN